MDYMYDENLNLTRNVLYGVDIQNTSVPRSTLQNGAKVIFKNNQGKMFGMNDDLLSKHTLLIGGIGTGKTNVFYSMVQPLLQNMTQNDVMLIFDTKGDFYNTFYQPSNLNHWVIGTGEKYETVSRSWNIFDEMRDDSGNFSKNKELIAKEIGKQLFVGRESKSQPFFHQAAQDVVSKVLIHLMRQAEKNHTESQLNTCNFVGFLKSADKYTYHEMSQLNPDFKNIQSYFGNPEDRQSNQALGVFSTINEMVNDLFVDIFANKSWAGDFSMRRVVREKGKKVVFCEYDLNMGKILEPMYRLMFDLAFKEGVGGREDNRGNVYVIIDEFKLLPNLMHIDNALNFGRSLGLKLICGLQNINQLYEVYGMERGKNICSGFSNCFCFQNYDANTRQYMSEHFGNTYENLDFNSRSGQVPHVREGHVVEDWDILHLQIGQAYVQLAGYDPFLYQFPEYKTDKGE